MTEAPPCEALLVSSRFIDETVASASCCSSSIALCSASLPFGSGLGALPRASLVACGVAVAERALIHVHVHLSTVGLVNLTVLGALACFGNTLR